MGVLLTGETPVSGLGGAEEGALNDALNIFGNVWTRMVGYVTGNEILMCFIAGSLLILAFKVFKRGRKSVK